MRILNKSATALAAATALLWALPAHAESIKAATQDVTTSAKKTARNLDDKACQLMNGKMQCLGKKAKHSAQNIGDDLQKKTE